MVKPNRWRRWLIAFVALALVAAACGGESGDDDDGAAEEGEGTEEAAAPEPVPGFDGETIRLGVVTPTSGIVAVIGEPLTNGNRAYWEYVNEELGGVAGQYPVELVIRDSAYEAPTAVQEYNAIKDDVVMFNQLLGTPIVNALLEQLQADNVVAQPATLDSFWVREQNLVPIGAPYQIQSINGVHWYVTEGGGSEDSAICTLRQDDPYGEAGQEGVDFALEELGIELTEEVTFPAGNPDFTAQISQLQGAGCEMVWLTSTPTDTGNALGKAAELGYAPQWMAQSPTWIGLFVESELLPYLEENFIWVSEGPEYGDTSVPGMEELIRIKDTYAPDQEPDIYYNFGYYESIAVHQVLEAAVEMGDLSREGIVEAVNSIDELSFDGLFGDYGWGAPEERDPPRANSIFEVDAEKPIGLGLIVEEHEAPFAADFEFETE
ncbi:MAG TPA: ABC transporter substrate-binding protein [Acidimicrobiales bacterium]|jgi:ABC-type branched-subunit amino acid transport system substrate-binding protein|nr:ABC transporter substrate-binding protein [Acidimicrobiales bacterium]